MEYESTVKQEGKEVILYTTGKEKRSYSSLVDASRDIGRERLWAWTKAVAGGLLLGSVGCLDLAIATHAAVTSIKALPFDPRWDIMSYLQLSGIAGWYILKHGANEIFRYDKNDRALKEVSLNLQTLEPSNDFEYPLDGTIFPRAVEKV